MRKLLCWTLMLAISLGLAAAGAAAREAPLVSQQTLKSWLKDPNLLIIDIRLNSYATSKRKIKGAVRHDPCQVKAWASDAPQRQKDRPVLLMTR